MELISTVQALGRNVMIQALGRNVMIYQNHFVSIKKLFFRFLHWLDLLFWMEIFGHRIYILRRYDHRIAFRSYILTILILILKLGNNFKIFSYRTDYKINNMYALASRSWHDREWMSMWGSALWHAKSIKGRFHYWIRTIVHPPTGTTFDLYSMDHRGASRWHLSGSLFPAMIRSLSARGYDPSACRA